MQRLPAYLRSLVFIKDFTQQISGQWLKVILRVWLQQMEINHVHHFEMLFLLCSEMTIFPSGTKEVTLLYSKRLSGDVYQLHKIRHGDSVQLLCLMVWCCLWKKNENRIWNCMLFAVLWLQLLTVNMSTSFCIQRE